MNTLLCCFGRNRYTGQSMENGHKRDRDRTVHEDTSNMQLIGIRAVKQKADSRTLHISSTNLKLLTKMDVDFRFPICKETCRFAI